MQRYEIGVDVGGTFTDIVVLGGERPLSLKVPTAPGRQAESVLDGIAKAAGTFGLAVSELLARTDRLVHGTTVATNMMIEGSGARVGMITTAGFRDELEYRRGRKEAIYDPTLEPPRPLVLRRHRTTVPERIDAKGRVCLALDEDAVRERVRSLRAAGCESLAIGFLFSFLDASHENRAAEIANEEWPGVDLSVSSEILPQVREYERFSTTAVNAYVGPGTASYLAALERELEESGFEGEFLVVKSNGGVIDGRIAGQRAVSLLLSGPAGGVLAAAEILPRRTRHGNLITIDMGGTSYDICLIADGAPRITAGTWIERHAVAVPMFGIHTIGAGGGSIARVDAGNGLHVGPASAGSDPGPACYGRGGREPTVTDANLLLGYLDPAATFGGSVKLDVGAARAAIRERVADRIGLGLEEAAYGILRVVNAQMTHGIRVVSVQQGHDPRDFALVAFGGNGAVHAGRQAEDLGIDTVLVPRAAGAFSALGGLFATPRAEHLATFVGRCDTADPDALSALRRALCEKSRSLLGSDHDLHHETRVACHYAGQTSEIWVPLELTGERVDRRALEGAALRFHDAHERERSFAKRSEPVHVIGLEVTSSRPSPRTPARGSSGSVASDSKPAPARHRDVYFSKEDGWVRTPIHEGADLAPGARFEGPAIVHEPDSTVVVYPGWSCRLDASEIYHLERSGVES
ncbi:N-methylhydantoinase A [Myxococcaceae bacterium]|jgi:N-methylhydantoinase A|nr:N-methylhydantoinase A [Myxococcaceae bacterium]